MQHVCQVGIDFLDGIDIAGMEGHSDHGTDVGEVYLYHAVVVSRLLRCQLAITFLPAVDLVELLCLLIGLPDRGKAGSLCGHNIDTDPEILAEGGNAGTYEFHYLILYKTVGKYSADNSQSHILRTYAPHRCTGQMDGHYLRALDVISLVQQLLYQLRTTLAHSHGAQCAVAGMGIGAKNHGAGLCQHLSGELVNNCLVRRYIDAAVLLGCGETIHVVILIDGAAYGAQRVMTVGQHVGHGKTGQSGSSGRLDDAYKGNIVRGQLVKADAQCLAVV